MTPASLKISAWWQRASLLLVLLAAAVPLHAADGPGQKLFFEAFELQSTGQLAAAAAKYEAGLKLEPKNAAAHYFAGEIYVRLGKPGPARSHLGQVLKLDPQGQYAARAQDQLAALAAGGSGATVASPVSTAPGTVFRDCPECPEMVVIPAGAFVMGSPKSAEHYSSDDERPTHMVTIGRPFALARTEVTRGQFAAFVKATGHATGDKCTIFQAGKWVATPGANWQNPGFPQDDSHPVVCVNWDDAQAYVKWLQRRTGKQYRLPSEAEWEYAARAGTTTRWYWGTDELRSCDFANIADNTARSQISGITWEAKCSDGHAYTAPGGQFRPNGFGLYDTAGNVWEWVEDCYTAGYEGAPINGSAWVAVQCEKRVLRGGSWFKRSGVRPPRRPRQLLAREPQWQLRVPSRQDASVA